jgi:hypothetical protein
MLPNKHCCTYARMHFYLKYALLCFMKYAAVVDLDSLNEYIVSTVIDEPTLIFKILNGITL